VGWRSSCCSSVCGQFTRNPLISANPICTSGSNALLFSYLFLIQSMISNLYETHPNLKPGECCVKICDSSAPIHGSVPIQHIINCGVHVGNLTPKVVVNSIVQHVSDICSDVSEVLSHQSNAKIAGESPNHEWLLIHCDGDVGGIFDANGHFRVTSTLTTL